MSSKQPRSLSTRLAVTVAISSLLIIILASLILYRITFEEQVRKTENTLEQLVNTVRQPSAISAYVGDTELAREVVNGLVSNDIVEGALLISTQGMLYSEGESEADGGKFSQRFVLISPFDELEKVGELVISPNQDLIKQSAAASSRRLVLTMVVYTLLILVILIPLVNWQLTRPIKKLADQLHDIKPGSEERLLSPTNHSRDEIGALIRDANGLLDSVQNTLEEERNLRQMIERLQDEFRLVFENASCGIALIDYDGKARMHNKSFEKIFGPSYLKKKDGSGQLTLSGFFEDKTVFIDAIERARFGDQPSGLDIEAQRTADRPARWLHCLMSKVSDESIGQYIELIVYDISERAHRERQVQIAADHDPLTQLYNRRAGEIRMQKAMDESSAKDQRCALMMIDLDHFKPINDRYGHESGDQVLIEVARRLNKCIRGDDIVVRWGGDEFVVFLVTGHDYLNPEPVGEKLLAQLPDPIELQNGEAVSIGVSIGIAMFPDHGKNLARLIEVADHMMYDVKTSGRNAYLLAS